MFAVDGQLERSKIHASSTAVKYSSALGNSTDKTGNNMDAGKQIIHLENTDITNDGVASTSDSDGVYTGHLIQIGSHGQEITTDGINVPAILAVLITVTLSMSRMQSRTLL